MRRLQMLGHAVLVVVPELAQVALPKAPRYPHATFCPHPRRRRRRSRIRGRGRCGGRERQPFLPRLDQGRGLALVQPPHFRRRLLLLLRRRSHMDERLLLLLMFAMALRSLCFAYSQILSCQVLHLFLPPSLDSAVLRLFWLGDQSYMTSAVDGERG